MSVTSIVFVHLLKMALCLKWHMLRRQVNLQFRLFFLFQEHLSSTFPDIKSISPGHLLLSLTVSISLSVCDSSSHSQRFPIFQNLPSHPHFCYSWEEQTGLAVGWFMSVNSVTPLQPLHYTRLASPQQSSRTAVKEEDNVYMGTACNPLSLCSIPNHISVWSHTSQVIWVCYKCLTPSVYVHVRLFKHLCWYHSADDSLHTCHLTAPCHLPSPLFVLQLKEGVTDCVVNVFVWIRESAREIVDVHMHTYRSYGSILIINALGDLTFITTIVFPLADAGLLSQC